MKKLSIIALFAISVTCFAQENRISDRSVIKIDSVYKKSEIHLLKQNIKKQNKIKNLMPIRYQQKSIHFWVKIKV